MKTKTKCSIPIFDAISDAVKTYYEECPTKDDAKMVESTYTELYSNFKARPDSFGCLLPCTRISFDLDISYFHENSGDPMVNDSNFSLFTYPGSNFIEDQVECLLKKLTRSLKK